MTTSTPFRRRLHKVKQLLTDKPFDTFIVSEPWNRSYLSGFWAEDMQLTESSGFLFISEKAQVLATDFRYQEQAEKEAPDFQVVVYRENLASILPEILASLSTRNLGFENHHLTYDRFVKIKESMQEWNPKGELLPAGELLEGLRTIKEVEEIGAIRDSLALTESVLETIVAEAAVGKTEKELAWRIEQLMREAGAEAVSFPPIVASGPLAAMPHAVVSNRQLQKSETIIIDLGARLEHYCSDMTRTLILGEADDKTRRIYATVREAQLRAIAAVRSGISSFEVDRVARDYITSAGYGDHFGHGLGHGVGLAVHEKPGFGKSNSMILEENMVVTIEPGIYLPGWGGVRLENMVLVTADGCEVLNKNEFFYSFEKGTGLKAKGARQSEHGAWRMEHGVKQTQSFTPCPVLYAPCQPVPSKPQGGYRPPNIAWRVKLWKSKPIGLKPTQWVKCRFRHQPITAPRPKGRCKTFPSAV